jgi:hypothetical protein
MKSSIKKKKTAGATPPGRKKLLLGLLFVCVLAGYAGSAYLTFHSHSDIQSAVTQKLEQLPARDNSGDPSLLDSILPNRQNRTTTGAFDEIRDLFRTVTGKEDFVPFTFQGTLAGKNGAIAMINNKPVAVGTEFQGVEVIAISNQVLILEYKGKTKKLGVGETVSVLLD